MRRIIERVVTVVTTTTWKISWETDTPHPGHSADSVSNELSVPEAAIQPGATVIEVKEVDSHAKEKVTDHPADKLPQ